MRRGEVWWADYGLPFGSEPGCRRPVVIVQGDSFNRSAIHTVIVVPMTSKLSLAAAPGNVRCGRHDTGLPRASVANSSQLSVIDRKRLTAKVGTLSGRLMRELEDGIRLVLGM